MNTLIDTIYDQLYEAIISGELKPGQKLHIAQLADQYEVGLSPVREALSRLLATELVTTISQKGFRVCPVSLVDLNDLYRTRTQIEVLALTHAIEKGNDEWEARIIASYHLLAKFEAEHTIKTKQDYREWEMRHRAFNIALLSACDLKQLLRIQDQLYRLTERYRRQWLIAGMKHQIGLPYAKEQKKIMDAVLARNIEQATKLLTKHYDNASTVIRDYFIKKHLFTPE